MVRRILVEVLCGRCFKLGPAERPADVPVPPITIRGVTLYFDLCEECRKVWLEPFLAEAAAFGQTENDIRQALSPDDANPLVDLRTCPLCAVGYKTKDRARAHLKEFHRDFYDSDAGRPWWPDAKREPCPYCLEPQFGAQGMAAHKRNAHPEEFEREQAEKATEGS